MNNSDERVTAHDLVREAYMTSDNPDVDYAPAPGPHGGDWYLENGDRRLSIGDEQDGYWTGWVWTVYARYAGAPEGWENLGITGAAHVTEVDSVRTVLAKFCEVRRHAVGSV